MILNGVYERFPRLRCAYMEGGCGWLPSWLHRIDEHLEMTEDQRVPRAHHGRHRLLRAQLLDLHRVRGPLRRRRDPLDGSRAHRLRDRLPHPDSKFPTPPTRSCALEPEQIDIEAKRKILWDNAIDLYRFKPEDMPAELREDAVSAADEAITAEIIRNALAVAAEEASVVVVRSSHSTWIQEGPTPPPPSSPPTAA